MLAIGVQSAGLDAVRGRPMLTDSRSILARLQREGWSVVRTRGSHQILRHPTLRTTVVVPHPKKDIPLGTVRAIYRAAGWPRE